MHHFRHNSTPDLDKFWVVTVVSNPARYRSRYDLYQKFKKSIECAGANLLTVELAFGDRPFEIAEEGNPNHVRLRTWDEIWHKENMINIGVSRLPSDWQYVAWIDADVHFMRHDWPAETIHQLQHHHVVQMFQQAVDLGPMGEVIKVHDGFVWSYMSGKPLPSPKKNYPHWHPGYAWATSRQTFDNLGGLLDVPILGSADHHMAWALVGNVMQYAPQAVTEGYRRHLEVWQDRALTHVKRDIGYVPGSIYHHWHGKKKDRKYVERWQILLKHGYDPDLDIQRDWQGLYALSAPGERMRADLRRYFHVRNEDSIDP